MDLGVNAKTTPIFPPVKKPIPIVQEGGCARGPVWNDEEIPPPQGFDLWTVHHVASSYTYWAIPPHLQMSIHLQMRFLLFYISFKVGSFLFV